MEDREEFLTARQLAKVLQVSESTVRRLARKRRIPPFVSHRILSVFISTPYVKRLTFLVRGSATANSTNELTMRNCRLRIYC